MDKPVSDYKTMKKFYVGNVDDNPFYVPKAYAGNSEGYQRRELLDHATSPAAVHFGSGIAEIAPGGHHGTVYHAFERGFYVLSGTVVFTINGHSYELSEGHYGVVPKAIPYSFYNAGKDPVQLFEMIAPQPKAENHFFTDTIFEKGNVPTKGMVPDLEDPRIKMIGKFEESQLPEDGGPISAVGARSASIHGVIIKEFVDRMLGAEFLTMFLVQFMPGGHGTLHDHPHEEIYFFLSGQAEATLEDEKFTVGAGQFVWTGINTFHSFRCLGDEPVRWIETQAPQPAPYEAYRFEREWAPLAKK